jgi:hypothetical protein
MLIVNGAENHLQKPGVNENHFPRGSFALRQEDVERSKTLVKWPVFI